jgi:urease accessory protein
MAGMDTITIIETALAGGRLQRLLTWLSPSFPVGAFSYSHGLESAVEIGLVSDRASLVRWTETIVSVGAGRVDTVLLRTAYEAVEDDDIEALVWALERGDAMQPTSELGLETRAQGAAFLSAVSRNWPAAGIARVQDVALRCARPVVYPVAVGAAAAAHYIPLAPVLETYLHAFAANIVSAGVRLVPLGQSDGLYVLSELEPAVVASAQAARFAERDDIGSATAMVDWASTYHETQYTRLFRS